MHDSHNIISNIKSIHTDDDFNSVAIDIFNYQYQNNIIYKKWVDYLGHKPSDIDHYTNIPFLPISLFKTHEIKSYNGDAEIIFSSSSTTGMTTSKHFVKNVDLYKEAYTASFEEFYGAIEDYTVLALLPSYLEREGSSLILMAEDFIAKSKYNESGFYLYNYKELYEQLEFLKSLNRKVILLGVSFALLEFAEQFKVDFPELIIMETGGMKGKRKELLRTELHSIYNNAFGTSAIHSEYGMTELMSQAYSKGNGIFECPKNLKILIRDTNDPLSLITQGKSGGINIIDLYNIHSCSFIATQDLGKINTDGNFEILGRFDNSDIRGCNLLIL